MFDLQTKDILYKYKADKSPLNLMDSFLSLSIVLAAKKSMKEKKSVTID